MGILENWKRAINTTTSFGDSMLNYIDDEKEKFYGNICRVHYDGDTNGSEFNIDTVGKRFNSFFNPSACPPSDYPFVRDTFFTYKDKYVTFLSMKFGENEYVVREKLNGWVEGTGIAALFQHYFCMDEEVLRKIKRMQTDVYYNSKPLLNDFGSFASDLAKETRNGRIW